MFFETLNIRGFGCLRSRVVFSPDKLNLAVADNETGKSTLVSALLAAFYGVVDDLRERRDKRPHRRNVTPWTDPEQFGLDLDFTSENRRWRIERDFSSGDVRLIDRETNRDHAAEYHRGRGSYAIGEELVGLPVDEFLKSFYLKQEEILEIRESKGLTHYIQGVATALEGGVSSELAIQRLRDARESYSFPGSRDGLKIENAIKRFTVERESHLEEIEKLERARRDIEPDTGRLVRIEVDMEKLRKDRDDAVRLGNWAEAQELRRIIESQGRLKAEFDALTKTADELKNYADFPAPKWEQLISLSSRVTEVSASVSKLEARLQDEIEKPIARVEADLQAERDLAGVQEAEARELETALSRLGDRQDRRTQAAFSRDKLADDLKNSGLDRNRYGRLAGIFNKINPEEKRFIEGFRAAYAEEEVRYRELKTRREWHERERALIVGRQRKIAGTANFFFLLAAVSIIASGVLLLLTKGIANQDWLWKILAGLGFVFGAVGAVTRGTSSGGDVGALKKLENELTETIKEEDEAKLRLERIGRELTELGGKLGFEGGHELLAEYLAFDEARDRIEPLQVAEKEYDRANDEFIEAANQLGRFFNRAGSDLPESELALDGGRELLRRYREAVRLGDEYRALKAKKNELETDLIRLRRDFDSNRQLCEEILRSGGVVKLEPLEEAVAAFREAREKHIQYQKVASEQLPRIRADLLADVDVTAKRERLELLLVKVGAASPESELTHQKEYYRDAADRLTREEERLREERDAINRRIVLTYDRYQTHYPTLRRKIEELDEAISRAETFRSEIETAVSIMSEISREVYRSWAAALSEEAAPFLEALNPRYGDLRFKEDLSFSVRDRNLERVIESSEAETILSTGARDEVFLSARLGIACYLSRGAHGSIPIVLDEPLAAADDDKFLTGMRFLMETLSRKHQVMVMSCHEERHRWLMEKLPDLYQLRIHPIVLR